MASVRRQLAGTISPILNEIMSMGGKISRFDLRQATIVLDIGIGCKGVHESLDHIDGIVFLIETNR